MRSRASAAATAGSTPTRSTCSRWRASSSPGRPPNCWPPRRAWPRPVRATPARKIPCPRRWRCSSRWRRWSACSSGSRRSTPSPGWTRRRFARCATTLRGWRCAARPAARGPGRPPGRPWRSPTPTWAACAWARRMRWRATASGALPRRWWHLRPRRSTATTSPCPRPCCSPCARWGSSGCPCRSAWAAARPTTVTTRCSWWS